MTALPSGRWTALARPPCVSRIDRTMARLMPQPLRVTPTTLATLQQAATTLVQRKTPPPRPRRCPGWRSPRQVDEYYATIAEHWFGVPAGEVLAARGATHRCPAVT